MIITRKIEIYVNEAYKSKRKAYYDNLFAWSTICRKAANILSTHLFAQDNIKDFVYLSDGTKLKLADENKDPDGMLNTSYQNSGYRLLSSIFKGQISSDIITCLNQSIQKTYKEEKAEYYKGIRSLRSYKKDIPMPFSIKNISGLLKEERNYSFSWFGMPMKTTFGRDRSGNEIVFDRCISGEYFFKQSAIQYNDRKNKWFLLLCVDIPNTRNEHKEGVIVEADLSVVVPIIARCGKLTEEIGSIEEFLYQRLRIQDKLHNLQKALRYANGGNGRKAKLQAIDRFHEKEKNYIKTKLHTYSAILINMAVKSKAEKIVLINQKFKEEQAKKNEMLLRNWSYYGLKEMIKYKALRNGIEVEEQDLISE
jgi:IS605 OrfB family transposase